MLAFLSINGLDAVSTEDSQGNSISTFEDKQSWPLGVAVLCMQVPLVAIRIFCPRIVFSSSVHFMMQFVDPRIFESKIDSLKIKVNYPLFLKKSKSNIFQKAHKEDLERGNLQAQPKNSQKNTPEKISASKYQITKKKLKKDKKPTVDTRDRQMVSGGFFSSRGSQPSNALEVFAYPNKEQKTQKNVKEPEKTPTSVSARSLNLTKGMDP